MCLSLLVQARPQGHLTSYLEAKAWYPVAPGQRWVPESPGRPGGWMEAVGEGVALDD